MTRIELIKKVEIFSGLDKEYLEQISEYCVENSYKEGETIIRQGDSGIGLFMIVGLPQRQFMPPPSKYPEFPLTVQLMITGLLLGLQRIPPPARSRCSLRSRARAVPSPTAAPASPPTAPAPRTV